MKQYLNFSQKRFNNYSLQHNFSTIFRKIELIFFVFLSLIFLTVSKLNRDFTNRISYIFVDLSTPFVKTATFPFNLLINLTINLEELLEAKKENEILKLENDKMRSALVKTVEVENENQELKNILKFIMPRSLHYKAAQIKSGTNSVFNQQFFLEVRDDLQIKEGSAVINNYAMVGRVVDIVNNKARLMLLTDANSHVPVVVSKARVRGVLVGNNSDLMEINYVKNSSQIKAGDLVFTSSDGEKLPPGLLVGVVKKVDDAKIYVEMAQHSANGDIATIVEY